MPQNWPPEYDAKYLPEQDAPFWNEAVETMDPREREETVILPKLREQLKYAYRNSPFIATNGIWQALPRRTFNLWPILKISPSSPRPKSVRTNSSTLPSAATCAFPGAKSPRFTERPAPRENPRPSASAEGTWRASARPMRESCGASACGLMIRSLSDHFSAFTWELGGPCRY